MENPGQFRVEINIITLDRITARRQVSLARVIAGVLRGRRALQRSGRADGARPLRRRRRGRDGARWDGSANERARGGADQSGCPPA